MKEVLSTLLKEQSKKGTQPISYWRTHPYIPQRIAKVNSAVQGKMDFKDYLNLTGEER
jgi:predicted Zn-dependent protease